MRNWAGLAISGVMFATVLGMPLAGSGAIAATAQLVQPDDAANLANIARIAAAKGDFAEAVRNTEHAVKLAPAEAAYRAQLGRFYLASGRFASADTAFGDALSLDPALGRVAVSRALVQLVLGHDDAARLSLAAARGKAPDADVGLALALLGQRDDAQALLETAVRNGSADARTRQNLALVYAFAGRWTDAATLAARDVPSDLMAERLRHWALIVQRGPRGADQALAILGVTMAQDPGQPAAIALAAPVAVPASEVAAAVPQAVVEQPIAAIAPAIEAPLAAQLTRPVTQAIRTSPVRVVAKPALFMKTGMVRISPASGFVVQLGAYASARRVETAWRQLTRSAAYLSSYVPAQSQSRGQVKQAGLYRLALGGFTTRADAARVCIRIRAHGGACFVRAAAGDRPMIWALKASRDQNRA